MDKYNRFDKKHGNCFGIDIFSEAVLLEAERLIDSYAESSRQLVLRNMNPVETKRLTKEIFDKQKQLYAYQFRLMQVHDKIEKAIKEGNDHLLKGIGNTD